MNTKKLVVTLMASTMLLSGCSFNKNKDVIIEVNEKAITKAEFEKEFDQEINNPVFKQLGINTKAKNGFMYTLIKGRVINNLVVKSLINQEIEKRNIKITDKDVNEAIKDKIEKVGSKDKFNEILKQNGLTTAQYKKELSEELKLGKLVSMVEKIEVSEADAKKYYNENVDKFKYPDKVRASHILISANPYEIREAIKAKNKEMNDSDIEKKVSAELAEKYKEAEKVLSEVKKDPTSFAKISKNVSNDTVSAKQGGDLGFFAMQEMVEPFAKAAFALKPNTISEIIKTPYGYHIIMVTDRMAAGQDSFDKVKEEIIMKLEQDKKIKVFENFVDGIKKNAKIEYLDENYDPEKLTSTLRTQAENNPAVGEEVDEANHSATPEPKVNEETKKTEDKK